GAAIGSIRSLMGNEERQRNVGVLWDVLNFWPRVTHPFAPRCYGEAIVPLLQRRIADLRGKNYGVILAGHSQGSVVSAAAVAGASAFRGPLHLVTYGSPLAAVHERFFPSVFGGDDGAIAVAERKATSWHHFFGLTEPFAVPFWAAATDTPEDKRAGWPASLTRSHADTACPVCGWSTTLSAAPTSPDVRVVDYLVSDPDRWIVPLDLVKPQPLGHSTYHRHREVDQHLAHLARKIADGPAPGGADPS
ncbi:MAG: hypothetical protein Q8K63_06190, partial [Acidimicrobiales bacterium]|nr:hypothetical protein [Acidimicrobiales bacterium]